jgi:hypothetical protein
LNLVIFSPRRPVPPYCAEVVFTLVYLSTMRWGLSDPELAALLDQCRRRNAELDVTGVLVFRDGDVMQLLEGEEAVVRRLYGRILRDPRHHGLLTIWTDTAEHRRFPGWTMGLEDVTTTSAAPADGPAGTVHSQLQLVESVGTAQQRDYVRRRNAALREALVAGEHLIRALSVILHGHDPATDAAPDGSTRLLCRACRRAGEDAHFPCEVAVSVLEDLEQSLP